MLVSNDIDEVWWTHWCEPFWCEPYGSWTDMIMIRYGGPIGVSHFGVNQMGLGLT